ncbi:recombinase family protein [Paraglaciecola sp. Hal342]|jgi:DNA invertase Pin-like site-specific DNA recombinase|tara:strand:+ start:3629 stop:4174 length:546 start_codon:yes stop_codon:yes gene_type:complete
MTIFAYCRVSTTDQDAGMQVNAIKRAYPDAVVREEKKSGTTTLNRDVLMLLLDMISTGDKLVVWKLDRLARNMNDLTNIVETIEAKGASLEILDQRIDTGTASGKAFLQMLGVFAEFETNLRKERQIAGIAKAKEERPEAYQGRRPTTDGSKIKTMLDEGMKPSEVAKRLGISRATVYRYR